MFKKSSLIDIVLLISKKMWPSFLGLQKIPTDSLQRGKIPATSVLDMTLNNLMVRLQ